MNTTTDTTTMTIKDWSAAAFEINYGPTDEYLLLPDGLSALVHYEGDKYDWAFVTLDIEGLAAKLECSGYELPERYPTPWDWSVINKISNAMESTKVTGLMLEDGRTISLKFPKAPF